MFEAQVAYYLNTYLGNYLQGLDADSLRISVWRGDVELRNLSLRPEALQDLDLPVTVKAGLLGRLTLKVPWTALGREPVVVEFDRLYILACPKEQHTAQGSKVDVDQYEAEVSEAELAAKRRRVLEAETQWLQELQAKMALKAQQQLQQRQQRQSQKAGGKGGGGGGLFNINFQSLIHTILGNLQLRLTKVHIRYEDSSSLPGQRLSGGVLLGRVSAHTVDEAGHEAFVTTDVLNLLRKAVVLEDLGVYFDVGSPFLEPPRDWSGLSAREWDVLFSPAHHNPGCGSSGFGYQHHFLLLPISGQMNYVRRSSKFILAESSSCSKSGGEEACGRLPRQEGRIALRALSLALSREQYVGVRALLEALDDYTANAPYRAMRPNCRPASGTNARVWWRYTFLAVRKQLQLQRGGGCSWSQLQTACSLRKKYVPAYAKRLLTAAAAGAASTANTASGGSRSSRGGGGIASLSPSELTSLSGDPSLKEMDAQLPEGTILLFRRMAYAMAQSQKPSGTAPASAKPSANAQGDAQASAVGAGAVAPPAMTPAAAAAGGSWVGWLMGMRRPTAAAATAGGASKVDAAASSAAAGTAEAGPGGGAVAAAAPTPVSGTLSPEEWDRLQELLHQADVNADVAGEGPDVDGSDVDDPYCISALLEVAVERCSLELGGSAAEGAQPIVSASMQAVGIRLLRYPITLGASLRVGWAGLETQQGMLLCTGQLESGPQHDGSIATLGGAESGSEGGSYQPTCAFMLDFVRRPQDGSADAKLSVRLAPSYVMYNTAALAAVNAFFTSDQQIGRGNLPVQAAARLQRLQRLAQFRLRALSQERPRLLVQVIMHAPKVALADDKGRATLLMDLGCFSLSSSSPRAQSLTPGSNEASLYECFDLGLERVEAALVDRRFTWPTTRPPLPAALEKVLGEAVGASASAPEGAAAATVAAATFALLGPLPSVPGVGSCERKGNGDSGGAANASQSPLPPLGLAFVSTLAKDEEKAEDGTEIAAAAAVAAAAEPASEDFGERKPFEAPGAEKRGSGNDDVSDGAPYSLVELVRYLESLSLPATPPSIVVTLLPRFGVQAALQVAAAQDPRLPAVRLKVAASPLRIEFSPWRFHRLMAVLSSFSAVSGDRGATGSPTATKATTSTGALAAAPLPLWVTDAEYVAPVQLLSWEGVGGRVAKWQPRSLSVWRGRVFLSKGKGQAEALETRSYWRGWRLLDLPPDQVSGAENAVALVPESVRREAAAESPDALVLRLTDGREVSELRRGLNRSAALVESVAGLLANEDDAESPSETSLDLEKAAGDGSGGVRGVEIKTVSGGGNSDGGSSLGITRDLLDELLAHRDLFELTGSLASLELRLNGRPPRAWRAVRRLAATEPPPPQGAEDLSIAGAVRTAEMLGSMYQKTESHAGTDWEASWHRPGGSASSLSDFGGASASVASSTMPLPPSSLKPTGQPGSVAGGSAAAAGETEESVEPTTLPGATASGLGASSQHAGSRAAGGSDTDSDVEFTDAAEYDDSEGDGGSVTGGDERTVEEQGERLRELSLEQEVPLLAVALTSVAVRVQYSADQLAVALQMHALQMDDEFMGSALGEQFAVLAASSSASSSELSPSAAAVEVEVSPSGGGTDAAATGSRSDGGSGGDGRTETKSDGDIEGAPLVQLGFTTYSSASDRYKGLDSEISLQLSGLSLTCHRPTVAALMGLGSDMSYANSLLAAEKSASTAAATAAAAAAAAALKPPEATVAAPPSQPQAVAAGVVRSGGEGRTLMRLRMSMARLQLVMPYEVLLPLPLPATQSPPTPVHAQQQQRHRQGLGQTALDEGTRGPVPRLFALAEMDSFSFCLDVRPSSLELTTSLGNFTAEYGALPVSSPYRTICTLRPGTSGSLIEVTYRMHSASESLAQTRVPSGQPYSSLSASLSAVQVVYMGRFLNELLPYLTGMLAMQPKPRPPITATAAAAATGDASIPSTSLPSTPAASASPHSAPAGAPADTAAGATAAATEAVASNSPMVLLLDVSLASPVITLPQNSASGQHVQLDLGTLRLANSVAWRRGVAAAVPRAGGGGGTATAAAGASGGVMAVAGGDIASPGVEGWHVLMDEIQVRLTDMSLVVGQADDFGPGKGYGFAGGSCGGSGQNIIRDVGLGVIVSLHRSLAIKLEPSAYRGADTASAAAPPPPPLTPVHADVTLPQLAAVISEAEYRRLLAVLSGNFGESSQNDPRVTELHQILQRLSIAASPPSPSPLPSLSPSAPTPSPGPTKATSGAGQVVTSGGGDGGADGSGAGRLGGTGGSRSPVLDFSRSLRSILAALGDSCTVQATVAIGAARLTLLAATTDGSGALAPLTAVVLRDFWLGYYATARGGMFLSATLPTFNIEDLRGGICPEQRMMLSTAAATATAAPSSDASLPLHPQPSPSLLALEFRSVPATVMTAGGGGGGGHCLSFPAAQALKLRLQRPTLVLDFGLLLRLVNFVAPSPVLQGSGPRPYETRDVSLPLHMPYYANGKDLWLSPEVRLLADAPAGGAAPPATGFLHVYDGGGGRLVLPPGLSPAESLPLIVVGTNRALKLKNVRIVNCASLPSCLSLGPGAHLQARDEDGVKFVLADPEVDRQYGAVLAVPSLATGTAGAGRAGEAAAQPQKPSPPPPPSVVAAEAPLFEMSFDALGASLHLVEAPIGVGPMDESNGGGGGGGDGQQLSRAGFGSVLDLSLGLGPTASPPPPPSAARPPWLGSSAAVGGAAESTQRRGVGVDADAAAAVVDAMAQRLRRRLVLQLDASARFTMQGQKQEAEASLRSLTMRTLTVFPAVATTPSSATASATPISASPPLSKVPSGSSLATAAPSSGKTYGTPPQLPVVATTAHSGPSTTIITTLLEPADVVMRYSLSPTAQDLTLDLDSLTVRLSPAALHLLLQLQDMVLQPLMVPPPDKPLMRCERFERLWSSHWNTRQPGGAAGVAGGGRVRVLELGVSRMDSLAEERGVTVWRPQPVQGYVSLGDMLTAGTHMPTCQVATMAINSGLVAFPTTYEPVWHGQDGEDFALWRPLPPPGYVALGCVVGSRAAPPPLAVVGCVAARACVEARLGECFLLSEQGSLWAVQNASATFEVSTPGVHLPAVHLYDLRIPLGVPPAALTPLPQLLPTAMAVVPLELVREASLPLGAASEQPPLSLLCQQRYLRSRSALIRRAMLQAYQLPCVEFTKIWWDKNASSPAANRLSFWRPNPPPGYVFLGDCSSQGIYAPPPSVTVLRDSDPAAALRDGRPPSLARPINYVRVWFDEHRERQGDPGFLVLWKPVPPAGYVPLGLVAGLGPRVPSLGLPIRCVRADLVTTETLPRSSPEWILPAYRQRTALRGWTTDQRTGTFIAMGGSGAAAADISGGLEGFFGGESPSMSRTGSSSAMGMGATFEGYRMKLDADDPWATPAGVVANSGGGGSTTADGSDGNGRSVAPFRRTDLVLRLHRAVVLLRTSLGRPLLELDIRNTTLSYQSELPDLSRSYAYLNVSAWTHNPSLGVWEPLLEPWELLAHLDDNRSARPIAGVSTGTSVRITSTQSSVQVVLSASTLKSLLEALSEWTGLTSPEGLAAVRRQLAYGEAAAGGNTYGSQAAQQGLITNALGCPVSLLTDLGDRQAVVELQPDAEDAPVLLQPPPTTANADSRAAGLAPPPVPAVRMFVDAVSAGPLPEEFLREGGLMLRIKVNGPVAEFMPESTWGLYTRAVDPAHQQVKPEEKTQAGRKQQVQEQGQQQQQQQLAATTAAAPVTESVICWDERFLLKLPVEMSEQLLCPAPGDNQFDGVPLQLDVSLLACGAAGGPPRVVAAGTLPLQSDWLANEVDTLRNTAAAAAAAATASGMLSLLGATGDGVLRGSGGAAGSAASDVSETMNVRLFPARVVRGGDGSGMARGSRPMGHGGGTASAASVPGAATEEPTMLLQLRLSLDVHQVDSSWQPFLSRTRRRLPAAGEVRAGAAAAVAAAVRGGRRAVRLYGSDVWVPFGQMGGIITSGPGGDMLQASSCIPIRAGPGLVLERSSGPGGQPLELLRSLAVLVNGCGTPLEVSLVAGDPEVASWTLLAGSAKPSPSPPPPLQQPQFGSDPRAPGPGPSGGIGAGSDAAATPTPLAPIEEEVYENERFIPLLGWSSNNLLPMERRRYSRHGHSYSSFPLVPLPPGWEWEGPWQVETAGHVDSHGWFYALDWPLLRYPPTPDQARRKVTDMVRRRHWIRRRRWIGVSAKGAAGTAAAGGGPPRRLLGVVAPGDRLSLPLGWEAEGVDLQVRPVAATSAALAGRTAGEGESEPEAQVSHKWSGGLQMGRLDEGGARLLCCSPVSTPLPPQGTKSSGTTSASGAAPTSPFSAMALMPMSAAEATEDGASSPVLDPNQAVWLSVSLECEALVATSGSSSETGGGVDTLVDWRLVVRPPLTLHNTLPVASRFIVWERSASDMQFRVRQQGRVASGASVPVFSADMRMQVFLSFAPDGCEYGESNPIMVSDGYMRNAAGVAAAPRLPDSFRCTYSHSASFTALRVQLLREVDTSAASGVLATGGRRGGVSGGLMSPGEAVAHGYPLAVSLHVPIWLVNATQLPVSCGIMAFEAPPPAAGPTDSSGGGVGGGASAWSRSEMSSLTAGGSFSGAGFGAGSSGAAQPFPYLLRVIDTEAFRNTPRPESYVSVMPRSLELLSYPPGVPGPLAMGDGDGGGNNIQVAVVLRLFDSRWTQPIYLPRPGEQLQPRLGAGGVLLPSDRLLIRALCKDGCIHEVAVRLESAPLGLGGLAAGIGMVATRGSVAVLVRLEHHVLLTNTTGYPLTLLQLDLASSASSETSGSKGGFRNLAGIAGGGLSFNGVGSSGTQLPVVVSRAMSTATAGTGGGGGGGSGAGRGSGLAAALTVSLPPGSLGVPLHWAVPAASRHQLCLALPLVGETVTSASAYGLPASCMWSEPLKVDNAPGVQDSQVALPVYCLGPVGRYHSAHASGPAAGALAAMAALSNMTPQQQRLYELQRAHTVARQMFAALCGGGVSGVGDPGVDPKSFKLDKIESASSAGSGTVLAAAAGADSALRAVGGDGSGARKGVVGIGGGGSPGLVFNPGVGPGMVQDASAGDAGQGGGGGRGGEQGRPSGSSPHRLSPSSLEPNLVRIVRPTELLGNVEFLAVLLNVRLVTRAPGCLTLQLISLGGQPQQLLHNATPNDLMWRQASPRAPWARLPGYSAAAVCRGVLGDSLGAPVEVELRDTEPQSESSLLITTDLLALGSPGGGGGGGGGGWGAGAGSSALRGVAYSGGIFNVGQKHREVMAQACSADDLVLTPEGLSALPGAVGTGCGASRLETVVRIVVVPPPLGLPGAGPRLPAAAYMGPYFTPAALYVSGFGGGGGGVGGNARGGRGGVSSSTYVNVSIGSLELSLVDAGPEEIAVLTVDDLTAELTTGRTAGVDFMHLSLKLRCAQLDDQNPGSAYPVVLQPLEHSGASSPASGDPLFVLRYCCQPGKLRSAFQFPVIAARLLPLRLSLAETLMWRMWIMAKNVSDAGKATQQPLERQRRQQQQQVAGSDLPLDIDLMVVEDLPVRLSFRAEATFRPRWASGGFLRLGLDLAQLEDLALELPGIELERARLLRSELLKKVYDRLQERIFSMALAVLRSAGLVGGISKVLAVSSAGVAQLASDSGGGSGSSGKAAGGGPGGRAAGADATTSVGGGEVRSLQGGVFEGGLLIAKGVLAGATGIITKPVEGAERGGLAGFLGGLAKGLVGAAANPVSGALAAVSKVTEGFDATRRNITGVVTGVRRPGVGRKRLQRAFTGDNILRPFNLHTALGQALLYSVAAWMSPASTAAGSGGAGAGGDTRFSSASGGGLLGLSAGLNLVGALPGVRGATSSRPDLRRDRYELHWLLPGSLVLMLTERRVLAMRAPEFCILQERALAGDISHVTDVPSSDAVVLWHLPWSELLSVELAWFQKDTDRALAGGANSSSSSRSRTWQNATGAPPLPQQQAAVYGDMYGSGGNGGRKVPPDGLVLHRKHKSEDDRLYYEIHCTQGSYTAAEIRSRFQEVRYRCFLLPRQQERGWRDSQPQQVQLVAAAAMAAGGGAATTAGGGGGGRTASQSAASTAASGGSNSYRPPGVSDVVLPDTMLSQDFKLVWAATGSRASGGRSMSVWRPVGPPGYVALGDVAVIGREAPRPVRLYKDSPALAASAVNASGSGDAPASEAPRLAPPIGFNLIFRDGARPPITVWRPEPPQGYAEMGCVLWPEIEEPPLGLVRCLRKDLVAPGKVFDSPVWAGGSSDNPYWRCSMWPVDCPAGTFMATQFDAKKPSRVYEAVF